VVEQEGIAIAVEVEVLVVIKPLRDLA